LTDSDDIKEEKPNATADLGSEAACDNESDEITNITTK
jgi:hypothetical protein